MNERIQELLHQCSVPDDQAENYSKSKGLVIPDQKLDVAKFAELIVRECANMAKSFHHHQYDFTGNLELHEFIKTHFGVEE